MKRTLIPLAFCLLVLLSSSAHSTAFEPQIRVSGNSVLIDNGAVTTSPDDNTNFGKVATSKINSYIISNTYDRFDLNLTGNPPIRLKGSPHFTVSEQPQTTKINNDSAIFKIKYEPTTAGHDTAIVSIANNDSNDNPFTFMITGNCPPKPYSINTTIWHDSNENGIIDQYEKGLKNVVVSLWDGNIKLSKHYTNNQGQCHFCFLEEKNYTIKIDEVTLPQGAVCTTAGLIENVKLEESNGWVDLEFGFAGDRMNDENGDPVILEPQEPEIPGNTLVVVPETGTPTCLLGKCQTCWENLVDQDYDGWDGTVVAAPPADDCDPQVILEFADHNIYKFNYIQYQTDNGSDDDHAKNIVQADELEILVSTTGREEIDFESIGTFKCTYGREKMQWFKLEDYISAKYIKLVITKPKSSYNNKQLVEFGVNTDAKNGAVPASKSTQEIAIIPRKSQLLKSYPNPFNPVITIPFELNIKQHVTLNIFDIKGRIVAELANKEFNSGRHQITWNGSNVPSGMYFVHMHTPVTRENQSIILLK